ncbi:unnamed protein product, partial [marine sediment metagenome]
GILAITVKRIRDIGYERQTSKDIKRDSGGRRK